MRRRRAPPGTPMAAPTYGPGAHGIWMRDPDRVGFALDDVDGLHRESNGLNTAPTTPKAFPGPARGLRGWRVRRRPTS